MKSCRNCFYSYWLYMKPDFIDKKIGCSCPFPAWLYKATIIAKYLAIEDTSIATECSCYREKEENEKEVIM